MIPCHFSDSCVLNYSNKTIHNLSSTLELTKCRLSPCGYECLIWVLVAKTDTLGLSYEMILCLKWYENNDKLKCRVIGGVKKENRKTY